MYALVRFRESAVQRECMMRRQAAAELLELLDALGLDPPDQVAEMVEEMGRDGGPTRLRAMGAELSIEVDPDPLAEEL